MGKRGTGGFIGASAEEIIFVSDSAESANLATKEILPFLKDRPKRPQA
jgi:cysteine sulfinate desulfinase/cysteine desulfurase-like protein